MIYGINRFDSPEDEEEEEEEEPHDSPYLPQRSWFSNESLEVRWSDVQEHLPTLTADRLRAVPDEHILFFWASSVFLQVYRDTGTAKDRKRKYIGTHSSSRPADILDSQGNNVGIIERMGQWQQAESVSGRYEFIALGRQDLGIEELRDLYPPKVVAMQIRWEDGVAYREHIAEVDQAAWEAAQPTWKLIALK